MIDEDSKKEITSLLDEISAGRCRKSMISKNLGVSLRSVENWRKHGTKDGRKNTGRVVTNKLSPKEVEKLIKTACNDRFKDLTPYQIVAILAEEGVYIASESTFYRELRKAGMLRHRTNQRRKRTKISDDIVRMAAGPNQIWSWDITYLKTDVRGKFLYLYLVADIWSRFIIGWEIHDEESKDHASRMIERLTKEHGIMKNVLILHSDNGSPMKNQTMFATLQKLGVACSFSRPNVSNDNAYSESLFKTLKYTAGYPEYFDCIESAERWMKGFVKWYNFEHRHSGIEYVTPIQRHEGNDISILERRRKVYENAKKVNPERWSRHCRKWEYKNEVYLKKVNGKKKIA